MSRRSSSRTASSRKSASRSGTGGGGASVIGLKQSLLLESSSKPVPASVGSFLSKRPSDWSRVDVLAWLDSIDMSAWKGIFWENHITGAEIAALTEDDLRALGVSKPLDRKKILKESQCPATLVEEDEDPGNVSDSQDSDNADRASAPSGASARPAARQSNSGFAQREWDNREAGSSEDHFGTTSEDMGHGGETRRPTTPKSNKQRAANPVVTIKLVNGDDIQAVRTSYDAKLSDLKAVIKDVWGKKMRIKFRDEEEDFISIRRQQDLSNVMNSLVSIKSTRLRLTLSSEEAPSPPAAPVADFELLNTVAVPCLVVNPQGTLHYANSAMKQLLPQECVGQPIGRILAGDVRVRAGGSFEAPMLPFTFASQHVLYSSIAGIVESGYLSVTEREINNIKYLIGTIAHYGLPTCLSWLQQERESLDRCSVPGVAIEPTGIVIAWNSAATSFFGYTMQEMVGRNINVLMTGFDKANHDAHLRRYRETGKSKFVGSSGKVVIQTRSGSLKPAILSVTQKHIAKTADSSDTFYVGTIQDASS